jgi:hypothetical protein
MSPPLLTYVGGLILRFIRDEDVEIYANEIGDKTPDEVESYYAGSKENWTCLPGKHGITFFSRPVPTPRFPSEYARIKARLEEGRGETPQATEPREPPHRQDQVGSVPHGRT